MAGGPPCRVPDVAGAVAVVPVVQVRGVPGEGTPLPPAYLGLLPSVYLGMASVWPRHGLGQNIPHSAFRPHSVYSYGQ